MRFCIYKFLIGKITVVKGLLQTRVQFVVDNLILCYGTVFVNLVRGTVAFLKIFGIDVGGDLHLIARSK